MKRFEFRLHRVLALRRQQAEVQRGRVSAVLAALKTLDADKAALEADITHSRNSIRSGHTTGDDLVSLARYEAHVRRRCAAIAKKRIELEQHLKAEQLKAREAERKVKLLEKLEAKRRAEWDSEASKELESLAADAHLSRMQSLVREQRSRTSSTRSPNPIL